MKKKPSEFTDQEVIQCLLKGKENEALQFLYKNILPKVRHLVYGYHLEVAVADDLFQEATLVFYQYVKEGKFNTDYQIQTFIITVAKRKLIDLLRKEARNKDIEHIKESEYYTDDIEGVLINADMQHKVEEVLSMLGEKCKELMLNYEFHGYSMKEICNIMGFKNEETAKASKYKCKKKLIELFNNKPELVSYFKN